MVAWTPGTVRRRSISSWRASGLAALALTSRHQSPVTRWHSETKPSSPPSSIRAGPIPAQSAPPVRTQTNAVRGSPIAAQSSTAR